MDQLIQGKLDIESPASASPFNVLTLNAQVTCPSSEFNRKLFHHCSGHRYRSAGWIDSLQRSCGWCYERRRN